MSEVGLKRESGLKMPPLVLPCWEGFRLGRTGGWAEGRRLEEKKDPRSGPPASLLLYGAETLRPLLPVVKLWMPRKSVLKVRCGATSCGDAGRLSTCLTKELPGRSSNQERGRSNGGRD